MLLDNLKNKKIKSTLPLHEILSVNKHFPSPVREWNNSIYVYNVNTLKSIPFAETSAMELIKGYFSIYNKKLEKVTRTKKLLNRFKKFSSNKIFVSGGEFKHTNNKVTINLYVFNRQKNNYVSYMKNWNLDYLKKKLDITFINKLRYVNNEGLIALKKANENKFLILKALNSINNDHINSYKYKFISNYINNFYKILLNRYIKKIKLYCYYKQLLYVNNSVLNYNFLQYLQKYIEFIYNKSVEFNLVNIKRFFLNSSILSESITLKISRNRKKLLRYLNSLKGKVKIYKKKIYLGEPFLKKEHNTKLNADYKKMILESFVFNSLKYKHITGFRLQGKGRLTRRYTASRSISKVKYKGNLLDIDSSYKGLSSVLLKGNLKSNLQTTKLNSKTRIGSFGIKGWISGN